MNAFFKLFALSMILFFSNIFTMNVPSGIHLQTSEGNIVVVEPEIAIQSEIIKSLIELSANANCDLPRHF